MELMERLVRAAVERGAQSLHIKSGDIFRARIHGDLVGLSESPFTPEDTRRIARRLLPTETDRERLDEIRDMDFAWELKDLARFRVNILRQRNSYMVVMRVIPWRVPTLRELNLPPVLGEIADYDDGMVLVTGATGVGKSTTQAAMVGWLNRNRRKHIITLEDPIEYWHDNDQCTITQREVGMDTESFRTGLRAALRQDPDVILVGEMRDLEAAEIALEAAETGHLVVSTMHAATATGALKHLTALFPDQHEEIVRTRLGDALRAIVSQRLVLTADGSGSVPAVEILRVTEAIRDCILRGEVQQEIVELMKQGREQYGMQTFDQHLMDLVEAGFVSYETALESATNPSDFELYMRTLRRQEDEGADEALEAVGSDGQLVGEKGLTQRF
ncbi:MAG: type IV pilus twitching motility protein PilT [Gemmatimonadota bacterium]